LVRSEGIEPSNSLGSKPSDFTNLPTSALFYKRILSQLQVVDLCPPRQSIEPNKHHGNVVYQLEIDEVLLPSRSVLVERVSGI